MNTEQKRELQTLIESQRSEALQNLLRGKPGVGQLLRRVEWGEKLLACTSPKWKPDAWVALGVAAISTFVAIVLLSIPVHDTPIHAELHVEAVVVKLAAGLHWLPTQTESLRFRFMDSLTEAQFPAKPLYRDNAGGISVESMGDVRVSDLSIQDGGSLVIAAQDATSLELRGEGCAVESHLSGEVPGASLKYVDGDPREPTSIAGDFARVKSAASGATMRVSTEVFALDLAKSDRLAFVRRSSQGLEFGRAVSSVLSGKITFFDDGGRTQELRAGDLLAFDGTMGALAIRPRAEGLLVSFDGRVKNVELGPAGRSANPSLLAYFKQNNKFALAGWAVAAIWGFLWSTRQVLRR